MTNRPEYTDPERIKASPTYKNSLLMRLSGVIWNKLYGSAPDGIQQFKQDRKNQSGKFKEASEFLLSPETAMGYARQLGIEDEVLIQIQENALNDASRLGDIYLASSPETLGQIVKDLGKKKPTS